MDREPHVEYGTICSIDAGIRENLSIITCHSVWTPKFSLLLMSRPPAVQGVFQISSESIEKTQIEAIVIALSGGHLVTQRGKFPTGDRQPMDHPRFLGKRARC